ncbi:DUF4238 domain-containing protein [Burkholderia multivorans]|uniref:DUF4238 domain-containing protein n=1 Tax=Burkholderia multivorans TaxID=87883 RepID=UPI000D0049BA|nr:DUF4238 domain-containing protein [Burkholderia multivorans]PRH22464.1 hypothetical protein C6T56_08235 [Burkholderia multivorans]
MNVSRPRKQHYLPQFYLRGFSDGGTHFHQIEKKTGKSFGARVADSAAIRDFHTLDFKDCPDPDAFEKLLATVEGAIAPALSDLLLTERFSSDSRLAINRLTAMLMARVPASKAMVEQVTQEVMRSVGIQLQMHGKLPDPPIGFEDALSFENLSIEVANWHLVKHMFSLAFDEDILHVVGRLQAELIKAPNGRQFITGDQPVAQFNGDARPEESNGRGGLADPDTVLTLPLSSELALALYYGPAKENKPRIASEDEIDEVNRRTIVMAVERLFVRAPDESITKLLLRHGHCQAGSEFSVIRKPGGTAYHKLINMPVMDRRLYEPLGAQNKFTPREFRPRELRSNRGAVYPMMMQRISPESESNT